MPSLLFLGHHVTRNGIAPAEAKVRVIRNFPRTTSKRGQKR